MLNDKLPVVVVVVVVPARPQAPSLPLVLHLHFLPLLLLLSVSVSVSVSLAGVNEAAFCLSAISFLLFSFHLFVLPGEYWEGRLKNAHSLTNYLESIYLSWAIPTSNCYESSRPSSN